MSNSIYKQIINLSREQVWQFMFDSETYKIWTSVFEATSSFKGSWETNSEIEFLDSQGFGMFSKVVASKYPEFVKLTHLGEIANGKKTHKPEYQDSVENYYLNYIDGQTEVIVEANFTAEMKSMMDEMIPLSLIRLKLYCENPNLDIPKIEISSKVNSDLQTVWYSYTQENHIVNWNFADISWHCLVAKNDLQHGGRFSYRMEARDGSFGFDLEGIYSKIDPQKQIYFTMLDGRSVDIVFEKLADNLTSVKIVFEAESLNPLEMQKMGWQSILDNFKKYTETL